MPKPAATRRKRAASQSARLYRVTGPQPVHHTPPGGTFTAHLDPGQEEFLITVGHIEIVKPAPDADTGG